MGVGLQSIILRSPDATAGIHTPTIVQATQEFSAQVRNAEGGGTVARGELASLPCCI